MAVFHRFLPLAASVSELLPFQLRQHFPRVCHSVPPSARCFRAYRLVQRVSQGVSIVSQSPDTESTNVPARSFGIHIRWPKWQDDIFHLRDYPFISIHALPTPLAFSRHPLSTVLRLSNYFPFLFSLGEKCHGRKQYRNCSRVSRVRGHSNDRCDPCIFPNGSPSLANFIYAVAYSV